MSFCSRSMIDSGGGGGGGGVVTKYTGTVTCGFNSISFDSAVFGFDTTTFTFGSRSPTTISAYTFAALYDFYTGGDYNSSAVKVSGFGADPTTAFISSVTANGITRTPASYGYSAGTATWTFTSGFSIPSSGSIAVTIAGN